MDKLIEMIGKAETLLKELEGLNGSLAAETDAGKRTEIDANIKGKSAAFETIKGEIGREKTLRSEKASLAEARKLAEIAPEGKDLSGDPAEPVDHDKDEALQRDGFFDYVRGKSLSGRMREALAPKSDQWKDAADGVRAPDSLVPMLIGKNAATSLGYRGKAIPMLSSDALRTALIPQDYRAELLELPTEPPHILERATVVPADRGAVIWPRLVQTDASEYGSVEMCWIDEGAEKGDTEATFENLTITAHEVAAYTEASIRLLSRSALQMEPLITRLFRSAMLSEWDRTFQVGTGLGQPLGITSQDPVTGEQIRLISRDTAGMVNYTDLVNLEYALRAYHRANCMYMYQDTAGRSLKLQVDTTGRPLFTAAMSNGIYDRLNGYPHMGTHRLPALGTRGDIVIGDWREYIVAMEQEIVIKRSEHFQFKKNLVAFVVYAVIGGHWAHARAFAQLDDQVASTTAGWAGSTTA